MKKVKKMIVNTLLVIFGALVISWMFSDGDDPKKEQTKPETIEKVEQENSKPAKQEPKQPNVFTEEETKYMQFVNETYNEMIPYFNDISQLSFEAADNPLAFQDNNWRSKVEQAYNGLATQLNKIKNYKNVPERFREIHELEVKAADQFLMARDKYFKGIDNMDANALTEAVMHTNKGNEYLQEATEKLKELTKEVLAQ